MTSPDKKYINKLLNEVSKGNENSFRELFYLYKDNVYTTLYNISNDEFLTEEVVQEAFIKLWEQKDKLNEVIEFDKWFYVLSRNIFISKFRKKTIYTEPLNILLHDIKETSININSTEYKELEKAFQDAIDLLSPKQKMTYILLKQDGLSRKEVAKTLNVSPETVKWNYEQATNKVRNHIIKHLSDIPLIIILTYLLKK